MKKVLIILSFMLGMITITNGINSEPIGDCKGTPAQAVLQLPDPLNNWGVIACTQYGHIITNKEGWIWTNPGGYSPVMIPSQMVRTNPKQLGNKSYFTNIEVIELGGKEAEAAVANFESDFDASETVQNVYSLRVVSVSGKELTIRFFDYGKSKWGVWCNNDCDPSSKFMLLNLSE